MKVKNSSCINRLAFRTLKKSAKRNIIAVAAIALTTLLITSLISVSFNITHAAAEFNARLAGCMADGYVEVSGEEIPKEISTYPDVKKIGQQLKVGYYMGSRFEGRPLELSYMDQNNINWCFVKPMKGRAPEGEKEVLIDRGVLTALGVEPELGVTVQIPYYRYASEYQSKREIAEFTVVGIYEENSIGPCRQVVVSKEFAEKEGYVNRLNLTCKGDFYSFLENMYKVSEEQDNFEILGMDAYKNAENQGYDFESIVIIGLFLVVLAASGYLIIYNIFQISVVNDISYYGLLKTIGVTGKQLKRMIRTQAMLLSVIGIPIGLILGQVAGIMVSPTVLGVTNLRGAEGSHSNSPWIMVLSAVFALITVFISCNKPGKIASRISPVEALRYSDVRVDNKNSKRVSGFLGMATRNLARNKKMTALVYLSMALPIVILSLGTSMAKGLSFENYYQSNYAFYLSNSDHFAYEIPDESSGYVTDFVLDSDIQNIQEEIGFELAGSTYTTIGIPRCGGDEPAVVMGFDDVLFDKVEVVEGDMKPLFAPDSNAIAVTTDCYSAENLKVGDHVTVNYYVRNAYDGRTNQMIKNQAQYNRTPLINIYYDYEEFAKEYEVCAVVDIPGETYIGYMFSGGYSLLLPQSRFAEDTQGKYYRYVTVFDTKDTKKLEKAEEFIKEYSENNSLRYCSAATEREDFEKFGGTIRTVTNGICVVLLLIGLLNFVNAVLTGILTRTHEFAILKAIGMTDRQQTKVLATEGILYAVGSILTGIVLYSLLHFPFVRFWEDVDDINPNYSLSPLLLIAIVFIVLGLATPYIVYAITNRKTVVERLRINQ